MDDYKIRLGHTDSVDSVDRENFLDVQIQNTSKELHFNDVKKTIDQYELFQQERDKCNRYRLILTINPFCSNVLFNPFTEIVKYEDNYNNCDRYIDNSVTMSGIDGDDTPKRVQMINNTEYSKEENGYVYLPGYDMFDNHILRNKSFKVVTKTDGSQDIYNTLADTLRDNQGNVKKMYVRTNGLKESPVQLNMHLYTFDDVLNFEDSVNTNLYEENGWFGFINHSNLVTNQGDDIERVLNNKEACEFVDMYPNRELFSFNPSYNKRFDRLEYNWDIALTYPYENDYTNQIVYGNGVNGLRVLSSVLEYGPSGELVIVFRTFVKHNLKRNESIALWVARNVDGTVGNYELKDTYFRVKNIGDFSNSPEDYFFYIDAEDVISDFETTVLELSKIMISYLGSVSNGVINIGDVTTLVQTFMNLGYNDDNKITLKEVIDVVKTGFSQNVTKFLMGIFLENMASFRFQRVVNGEPSKYYVRKFKKLPNFKKRKRDVVDNDLLNRTTFEEYENGDGNAVYDFDKEFYKLGFATTIYGDDCSQITYTDTIDVEHLTDNLGRPLSEIYVTIIKRNKGNSIWYTSNTKSKIFGEEVEQSHCFGEVTSGFEISNLKRETSTVLTARAKIGDVLLLNKTERSGSSIPYKSSKAIENNVTIDQQMFFGDIVEFAPYEFKEYVLSDVNYRFNTYQREHPLRTVGTQEKVPFIYHNIEGDDYDYPLNSESGSNVPFLLEEVVIGDPSKPNVSTQNRDEGYYHKAHYKIALREFGDLQQDSHYDLSISSVTPVQKGNIFLKVKTKLPHKLNCGDIVLLFDDKNQCRFKFNCTYIDNKTTFLIIPYMPVTEDMNEWDYFNNETLNYYAAGLTWLAVTEYLRDGTLCLRRQNYAIPEYAVRAGKNTYLWRDMLSVNETGSGEIPEFTYTNNAFYVSKTIDFFLKRQDPDGNIGLYAKDVFPNDIIGKIKKNSIYEYKEEIVPVC